MKRIVVVEAVRGFAASYVLAGHLIPHTAGWTVLLRFGQEAVMIFFVVGFVIMHSTVAHPDKSFRSYLARRFFRIYPIFLFAALELRHTLAGIVIVTVVLACCRLKPWRLDRLATPFAVIAPISYGIYALQWPILTSDAAASLPLPVRLPCEVLAVVAVAYAAEMASRHLVMRLRKRIERPAGIQSK